MISMVLGRWIRDLQLPCVLVFDYVEADLEGVEATFEASPARYENSHIDTRGVD